MKSYQNPEYERKLSTHFSQGSQVQSDLNKLSAEATIKHSSILADKCGDSEIVCTRTLFKKGSLPAI